jgi:hypothetical protein
MLLFMPFYFNYYPFVNLSIFLWSADDMKPGSVVSYCIKNFIALFYFKRKLVKK